MTYLERVYVFHGSVFSHFFSRTFSTFFQQVVCDNPITVWNLNSLLLYSTISLLRIKNFQRYEIVKNGKMVSRRSFATLTRARFYFSQTVLSVFVACSLEAFLVHFPKILLSVRVFVRDEWKLLVTSEIKFEEGVKEVCRAFVAHFGPVNVVGRDRNKSKFSFSLVENFENLFL